MRSRAVRTGYGVSCALPSAGVGWGTGAGASSPAGPRTCQGRSALNASAAANHELVREGLLIAGPAVPEPDCTWTQPYLNPVTGALTAEAPAHASRRTSSSRGPRPRPAAQDPQHCPPLHRSRRFNRSSPIYPGSDRASGGADDLNSPTHSTPVRAFGTADAVVRSELEAGAHRRRHGQRGDEPAPTSFATARTGSAGGRDMSR